MANRNKPGGLSDNNIKAFPTYKELTSYDSLYTGLLSCLKNKRYRRKYYDFYIIHTCELKALKKALDSKTYKPQPYTQFTIFCKSGQKQRLITEPAAIDNVLHHTVYRSLYRVFDRGFIYDSYGCRIGKGALRASDRCQQFLKQSPENSYYLQLDIRKFYYSIDHAILRDSIAHTISDPDIVNLMMQLVNPDSDVGLNVGAMISQLYGLIYLNRLDHYIKRVLKVKHYVRYVDDMVLIGLTKGQCLELKAKIETFLKNELKLELSKAIIQPIRHGINFVGFHTWSHKRRIRKLSLRNFKKSLRKQKIYSIQSHLGHAKRTNSYKKLLSLTRSNLPYQSLFMFKGVFKHDLLK